MNYVTPLLRVGGEPFRVLVLEERLGGARAVSAALSYKLVSALSHLCYWLVGLVALVAVVQSPLPVMAAIVAVVGGALAGATFWLTHHRRGVFEGLLALTERWSGPEPDRRWRVLSSVRRHVAPHALVWALIGLVVAQATTRARAY
jgi:hypothetical protein